MYSTLRLENEDLRRVISFLWDGNNEAFAALHFIKSNYQEWPLMIKWLKDNKITGQKLADLFKNESPDGGGFHMGALYIISRIRGHRHEISDIKVSDLI